LNEDCKFGDGKIVAPVTGIEHRVCRLASLSRWKLRHVVTQLGWETIGEAKDDVLNETGRVEMRNVAARTPTKAFWIRRNNAGETPAVHDNACDYSVFSMKTLTPSSG
jgi:hypothetical protein